MTIQVLSSKRIEGDDAEKDTLPTTTLPQGTQFTAIDTLKQYIWDGVDTWDPIATFVSFWDREYSFSDIENWVLSGPDFDISGGKFNWIANRPSAWGYSDVLGFAFEDTGWIQRCIYDVTNLTVTANPNIQNPIGLSSTTTNGDTAKDYLGIGGYLVSTAMWQGNEQNNTIAQSGTVNELGTNALNLGIVYTQVIRQSSTLCDFTVFNNPDYSDVHVQSTGVVIASGITALRYSWTGGRSSAAAETNVLDGTFDNLQYANGVTTPP